MGFFFDIFGLKKYDFFRERNQKQNKLTLFMNVELYIIVLFPKHFALQTAESMDCILKLGHP